MARGHWSGITTSTRGGSEGRLGITITKWRALTLAIMVQASDYLPGATFSSRNGMTVAAKAGAAKIEYWVGTGKIAKRYFGCPDPSQPLSRRPPPSSPNI